MTWLVQVMQKSVGTHKLRPPPEQLIESLILRLIFVMCSFKVQTGMKKIWNIEKRKTGNRVCMRRIDPNTVEILLLIQQSQQDVFIIPYGWKLLTLISWFFTLIRIEEDHDSVIFYKEGVLVWFLTRITAYYLHTIQWKHQQTASVLAQNISSI